MNEIPKPFLYLGLGGLLPFWALGIGALYVQTAEWAFVLLQAQTVYAATIISFLGAVQWGLVLGDLHNGVALDRRAVGMLAYSVVPSVLGWLIVVIVPLLGAWWMWPLLMIGMLASTYLADIQARDAGFLPDWYLRLRKILTLGAQGGLAFSLAATI